MKLNLITPPFSIFHKNKSEGVLYDSGWNQLYGETKFQPEPKPIAINLPDFPTAKSMRIFGFSLISFSVAGLLVIFQPLIFSEIQYRWNELRRNKSTTPIKTTTQTNINIALAQQINDEKEAIEKEYAKNIATKFGITNTKFSIYIPRIDARSEVIANINPANETEYNSALLQGVAHSEGSPLPDSKTGGTYLFAHSTNNPWNITKYNAIFYLLRELSPTNKDEIYIFYNDKVYKYIMSEKHTVEATDISWITQANTGTKRLILQTCWPPGTTWKRIIIVATPAEVVPQNIVHDDITSNEL